MESQKIINLLDNKGEKEDDPRFEAKKWYIVNDHKMETITLVRMCNLLLSLMQKL